MPRDYKDHGFASADAAASKVMYGKMYQIRKSDARRMDYYEGVPFLKAHEKIFQMHESSPFYYYRACETTENLKPTQAYLDYITTAYRTMDCVPTSYIEAMETTKVLDCFEPTNLTGQFISDLNRWPNALHPLLIKYERVCQRFVKTLWNASLLVWLIKT